MTFAARYCGEPVGRGPSPTGFDVSGALAAALALARPLAGERVEAIVLAGSHSAGEAVWATLGERAVSLSDLDVYVVLSDESACRAAESRSRDARERLRSPLAELGFLAPLEMGFLTRAGLARMSAKPGVIELRRHGRVIEGDTSVLASVPAWSANDVGEEERQLLLENRGFELLLAAPGVARDAGERLLARHATLKTALDLAGVMALSGGEWPDGAAARVEWARRTGLPALRARLPQGHEDGVDALEGLWETALAFRSSPGALDPGAAAKEWRSVARAWCAVWSARLGARAYDPWPMALRTAARAPMRRRVRQALVFRARTGAGPGLRSRIEHLAAGTPAHRVHGSAAVLLHAAALAKGALVLPAGALHALAALGVTRAVEWEAARAEVVRAWDLWLQLGQRTAESA